ncbi:hypothetical protein MKY66_06795 [Paenibacillus sp. FSL R5-0766]|uniref:hypothetical protein n=1 Tax=unclassified Paenibacillus TaxID=185978 RepID=UPI00096D2B2A|nr:hypothetical protein [Paenibacillus sp. FSL R5-0765]OMF66379.1 hypothetical protein BK141_05525 [Paenibacillus sp. FSL R5-0765]
MKIPNGIIGLDDSQQMAEKLNVLLDQAEQIARTGLAKCDGHSERLVYLMTFRYPNITAVQAAEHVDIAASTARRTLNALAEKELVIKIQHKKEMSNILTMMY